MGLNTEHGILAFGCPGDSDGTMWDWKFQRDCGALYMGYGTGCPWGTDYRNCNDYAEVSQADMTSETWQHVAITCDGTTLVGYHNGVEIARNDLTVDPRAGWEGTTYPGLTTCATDEMTTNGGYMFNIGSSHYNNLEGVSNHAFNGQMDEVAVYGMALAADDIAALYNDGVGLDQMGPAPLPPPDMATACSEDGEACTLIGCEPDILTFTQPLADLMIGYDLSSVVESSLQVLNFNVENILCAALYSGSPTASPCEYHNTPYSVTGCVADTCTRPNTNGYSFARANERRLDLPGFDVIDVMCGAGTVGTVSSTFIGTASVGACTADGEPYLVTGCTPPPCSSTHTANSSHVHPGSISGTAGDIVDVSCDIGYEGGGGWQCNGNFSFTGSPCEPSCDSTQACCGHGQPCGRGPTGHAVLSFVEYRDLARTGGAPATSAVITGSASGFTRPPSG